MRLAKSLIPADSYGVSEMIQGGDCVPRQDARTFLLSAMIDFCRRMAARAYDSAVAWSLVFTTVRAGGNLLVLPLMLHKLSPEDLGLWYVFLSLAGVSSLIDLGFYPTMSRVTAYLWAGAREIQEIGVAPVQGSDTSPPAPNYRLLADLVKTMQLYYRGLAIVITLLLGVGGMLWIINQAKHLPDARLILWAWLFFLLGILINTTNGIWHPLLSGINRIRLSQQILVCGLIVNYVTLLAGLLLGWGLLAPVAGYLLMGIVSRSLSRAKFMQVSQLRAYDSSARWSSKLLKNLWPTAWRTGVVTLGIYATLNLGTLICSFYLGLKATASYGLSLQLVLAAIAIATSFVAVKIPLVAQMHALGKIHEIARVVFPRMRWFWGVYAGLAVMAIFIGDRVLRDLFHSRTALLPTPLLIALFIVVGLEGHHAVFRDLAVASHRNPFAKPVIISGILIALLSFLLVPRLGLWGLILVPGAIQICFNNWWTVLVGLQSMGSTLGDYIRGLFGREAGSAASAF